MGAGAHQVQGETCTQRLSERCFSLCKKQKASTPFFIMSNSFSYTLAFVLYSLSSTSSFHLFSSWFIPSSTLLGCLLSDLFFLMLLLSEFPLLSSFTFLSCAFDMSTVLLHSIILKVSLLFFSHLSFELGPCFGLIHVCQPSSLISSSSLSFFISLFYFLFLNLRQCDINSSFQCILSYYSNSVTYNNSQVSHLRSSTSL